MKTNETKGGSKLLIETLEEFDEHEAEHEEAEEQRRIEREDRRRVWPEADSTRHRFD